MNVFKCVGIKVKIILQKVDIADFLLLLPMSKK